MSRSFHNTTNLPEQTVLVFEAKHASNKERIWEVFCEQRKPLCWSEVQSFLPWMNESTLKARMTELCSVEYAIKMKRNFRLMKAQNDRVVSSSGAECNRYKIVEINNLKVA